MLIEGISRIRDNAGDGANKDIKQQPVAPFLKFVMLA
jgi:hypothetical protein